MGIEWSDWAGDLQFVGDEDGEALPPGGVNALSANDVASVSEVSAPALTVPQFGELTAANFGNAEWTSTTKLRFKPPVLINPIEPGVTRDETKPGTGILSIIGSGDVFIGADNEQDYYINGSTHVAAGTRSGELEIRGGRNIRIEEYNGDATLLRLGVVIQSVSLERVKADLSGIALTAFPLDAVLYDQPGTPPADPGFANRPDIYMQKCRLVAQRSVNKSWFVTGQGPGTVNSQTITSIVDGLVTLASALPGGAPAAGSEVITHGNNLGGQTAHGTGYNWSHLVAASPTPTSTVFQLEKRDFTSFAGTPPDVASGTGTGGTLWALQGTGQHADCFQCGPDMYLRNLYLDQCTFITPQMGIVVGLAGMNVYRSRINTRYVDLNPQDWGSLMELIYDQVGEAEAYQVYIDGRTTMPLLKQTGHVEGTEYEHAGGTSLHWDAVENLSGVVYGFGPEADFCLESECGVGSAAPGFGDAYTPQAGDITEITHSIPATVDSGLAENALISLIGVTHNVLLRAPHIIDVHIQAGDTSRFKLTGRKLVRAGTALEADTEYELTLRATIRGTAITYDEIVTVSTVAALGSELVTNGGFGSDTAWTKGTGWAISGGVATKTPGVAAALTQAISLTAGQTYRVTFTITALAAGSIPVRFMGGTEVTGTIRATTGTFTEDLVALTGNNLLSFSTGTAFNGSIDNVSVKQVL